jgi:hypothetical protein
MPKLVVNPGSSASWAIDLKPGTNSVGRGFANDFKIEDPSVSGCHCQIIVNNGMAVIKDLGSTNGTFINRVPVTEAMLESGQTVHLGGVELFFQTDPPTYGATAPEAIPVAPPPPPMSSSVVAGGGNCKFHPRTPGRYFCSKCHHFFCELCVASRMAGALPKKSCRHCGTECAPVQVQLHRSVTKGFFRQLPGVFIYPFKGSGLLVLILGTIFFAGLDFISARFMFGIFILILKLLATGYLFSYMQNIIHSTAAEDNEMPELPALDGLVGAFFTFVGTVTLSFGPAIALAVAKFGFEVDIPTAALVAVMLLGCFYFPMAFLAVAMKDTIMAANPLIVIPSILKAPLEYLVTSIMLAGVFGARALGSMLASGTKHESYATHDMSVLFIALGLQVFSAFMSLYLLTVGMRILGLFYVAKKRELGWFDR